MAESFVSVHSDSWGQTCGKETQHLWLGSNHRYIHNITPAATWANRNAFAILNRSYVWRGVMFKELYCAYGRNCLSRHAMPIKKTIHSHFALKNEYDTPAFAHGSQSWHFLWAAQHCKQRASINIPQLTFSVSSPSPGFSYLINQLSFPLSEEAKRDIRFPFQRLCKQLASLL